MEINSFEILWQEIISSYLNSVILKEKESFEQELVFLKKKSSHPVFCMETFYSQEIILFGRKFFHLTGSHILPQEVLDIIILSYCLSCYLPTFIRSAILQEMYDFNQIFCLSSRISWGVRVLGSVNIFNMYNLLPR